MHALRHFSPLCCSTPGKHQGVSTYLGHADPGFTLRTYTHLMPTSETRARKAVDRVLRRPGDGPRHMKKPPPNGKPLVEGYFRSCEN